MNLFLLAIFWTLYLIIHSGMISIPVTNYLKIKSGNKYRFYRLFYNTISVLLLIPVLLFSFSIHGEILFQWKGVWLILKYLLIAIAILLFILGAKKYSMSQFLGLTQIKSKNNHGLINASGELDSSGILGFIRHPFYAAIFPLIWARDIDTVALVTNIIISIYTVIGTYFEEQKLLKEFGDNYRAYQKNVSMFFPLKWMRKKLNL